MSLIMISLQYTVERTNRAVDRGEVCRLRRIGIRKLHAHRRLTVCHDSPEFSATPLPPMLARYQR